MSERYQKKIRKEISAKYKQMFQQVLNKLESEAKSQNFFQRLKISMKYLFEKKLICFELGKQNERKNMQNLHLFCGRK